VAREWAIRGHGIAMKSLWDISADMSAGRLKILLPQLRSADAPVHALYQRNRYVAPRVRAVLDFLIKRFAEESRHLME
jgi:DNA-binding transcriptional LysR family regulator